MATSGATAQSGATASAHRGRGDHDGRTPAQWYCLLAGGTLLLAGIVGFIADASFGAGTDVNGDKLLGIFEVNGWHNIVHIASGLLLLGASAKRASAKAIALIFGVTYGAVALYGLIDGSDVVGLIPINGADNVLHIALAAAGIFAALASPASKRALHTSTATPADEARAAERADRFGRDDAPAGTYDPLSGRRFGGDKTTNR